jgi:AcrR family transcriptional regulator
MSSVTTSLLPPSATVDGARRRLWEAALTCFGERGYHGVSVREIAAAAGLQAGSIYSHVTSKEQLLADLVLLGHELHRDLLQQALLESSADPVDQIRCITRAHVRMHATYPLLARVCNRELGALSPLNRARVLGVRTDAEQLIGQVVERGARMGVFDTDAGWLGVAAIGGMGIRVAEWWDPALGFSVDEVADKYADFAARLLAP